jgi:hypothetical protein
MMRSLTMLNESGDTTISWTEDRDEEMQAIIEKKMAEGVTFFIIDREHDGARMKLEHPFDARRYRALAIPDEDLARFVSSGSGVAVPTSTAPVRRSRVSRSAKEVASSRSVGVKQRRGG